MDEAAKMRLTAILHRLHGIEASQKSPQPLPQGLQLQIHSQDLYDLTRLLREVVEIMSQQKDPEA